jgi:hypothetical protein
MLRTFVGYRGKMAAAQIGRIQFVILAKNATQLRALWKGIMTQVELDPAGIKNAVLIEASVLPERPAASQGPEVLEAAEPPEDPRQMIIPAVKGLVTTDH